jgi:hypothetical protein
MVGVLASRVLFSLALGLGFSHRGIQVEWRGLMKREFDMYVGIAKDAEILQQIQEAANTRSQR